MIDERTRIRENWVMSMETFREETLKKGLAEGEQKAQLNVARNLLRMGLDFEMIQEATNLDLTTIQSLASELV